MQLQLAHADNYIVDVDFAYSCTSRAAKTQTIDYMNLHTNWKVYTAKVTTNLQGWAQQDPVNSTQFAKAAIRGAVVVYIRSCCADPLFNIASNVEKLTVTQNPTMVVATAAIKKAELKLIGAFTHRPRGPIHRRSSCSSCAGCADWM